MIDTMDAYLAKYSANLNALTADKLQELVGIKRELKRLKRIHRAEVDSAYFEYEYLSDIRNPANEDNLIKADGENLPQDLDQIAPVHRSFHDKIDYVLNNKRNARLGIKAARGLSKSGKFSNGFPLHQVVFRQRKYILVLSETDGLAKKLIEFVNKNLKFNAKLIADFGPLLHERANQNEKDNQEAFVTTSGTLVEASSAGKQLRGKRHGSYRPDLCITDDPSSLNNEGTKEARQKLIHWFDSVLMPIGSSATCFIVIGTPVTASGLINYVFSRKDFECVEYPAVINPPENTEIWQRYLEVYSAQGPVDADAFYEANREEMEIGVQMAWPWRWTYKALMNERANMTLRAFNSEYLLKTYSEEEQFFVPDDWAYYDSTMIDYSKLTISGAWDIAMGKNARSDYNAVITVGKDEKTGYIYILDVYASKKMPHEVIDVIIDKMRKYKHSTFSVETIGAFHEFSRQLKERMRREGIYYTRINEVKSHKSSKEQRIESMEPLFANKVIHADKRFTGLLEQAEQYPNVDNDDILDALQTAVENIIKRKKIIHNKPQWL
jgi:predicted phage terminase large subunit-like protein